MVVPQVTRAYVSPINPGLYPQLCIFLCGLGIFFLSWFFIYEVTTGTDGGGIKKRRNIVKELLLAFVASLFLGFGTIFLLLWTGVYI